MPAGIDEAKIKQELAVRAEVALRRAAEYTLGRAKHHAPVRAIFKRRQNKRGPAFTNKGGISTAAAYKKFVKSKERRRRRVDVQSGPPGTEGFGAMAMRKQSGGVSGRSGSSPIQRVDRPRVRAGKDSPGSKGTLVPQTVGREARRYGRSTSFSGLPNSLIPVLGMRGKSGQYYNFTADLRRVGPTGPGLIQNRRNFEGSEVRKVGEAQVAKIKKANLTSRGRYEIKRARRGSRNSGLFQGRVGGRLRGEIRITPVSWKGDTAWIYVESPTEYAGYQEFGTRRHGAQPFLRPALYESRKILRSSVRKIGSEDLKTPPVFGTRGASSPVTPGRPGPEGGAGALL